MLILASLLLAPSAQASADIEFKTNGPVVIFVDGKQATLTSKMRQKVAGLEGGTHEVRVTGVFGKTLYEAEVDVPDGTMTWAEWERGQLKILRTEWLDDVEAEEEVAEVEEPVAEDETIEIAEPEAVPEAPAAPLAVAAVDAPAEAPEELVAEAEPEVDPDAVPVEAAPVVEEVAALPLAVPVQTATSMPTPTTTGRTLSVQASDGMQVEIVANGHRLLVIVEGDTFRIVDPNGLEMALGTR